MPDRAASAPHLSPPQTLHDRADRVSWLALRLSVLASACRRGLALIASTPRRCGTACGAFLSRVSQRTKTAFAFLYAGFALRLHDAGGWLREQIAWSALRLSVLASACRRGLALIASTPRRCGTVCGAFLSRVSQRTKRAFALLYAGFALRLHDAGWLAARAARAAARRRVCFVATGRVSSARARHTRSARHLSASGGFSAHSSRRVQRASSRQVAARLRLLACWRSSAASGASVLRHSPSTRRGCVATPGRHGTARRYRMAQRVRTATARLTDVMTICRDRIETAWRQRRAQHAGRRALGLPSLHRAYPVGLFLSGVAVGALLVTSARTLPAGTAVPVSVEADARLATSADRVEPPQGMLVAPPEPAVQPVPTNGVNLSVARKPVPAPVPDARVLHAGQQATRDRLRSPPGRRALPYS